MDKIKTSCPCCGVTLRADAQLLGSTIRCPKCLSIVPVKQQPATDEDLALPVEANYNAKPTQEESKQEKPCPHCHLVLSPEINLCPKCGYHLKLETFFEDLKEDNLKPADPKTKEEQWFQSQLHDYVSPREVLIVSAIFLGFLTMLIAVLGNSTFGSYSFFVSLPVAVLMWVAWYKLMQVFGVLNDPNRERRIQRQNKTNMTQRPSEHESSVDTFLTPDAVKKEREKRRKKNMEKVVTQHQKQEKEASQSNQQQESNPRPSKSIKNNQAVKPTAKTGSDDDQWLNDLV